MTVMMIVAADDGLKVRNSTEWGAGSVYWSSGKWHKGKEWTYNSSGVK